MRVAFASIASKTGSSSPGEELMTFNTSEVAVSRWDASPSSRVSWSSLSRKLAGGACLIGALRALGLFVRGAFTDRPLPRQCIGSDGDGINSRVYPERGYVRFGSKADICAAKRHVRFTPNSDRESEPLANRHVCFTPESGLRRMSYFNSAQSKSDRRPPPSSCSPCATPDTSAVT